jgi:hypothetical protein
VPVTKKKRNKVIDKKNCLVEMTVTKKHGIWTVSRLVLEHNHKLFAPSMAKLLRSHRYFSEQEKAIIRSFVEVNVPNRKILAFLAYLRGGMENTNLVKKGISNYRTKMLRESGENDITQVVQFLKQQQAKDPSFFFSFNADENSKVKKSVLVIWSKQKMV